MKDALKGIGSIVLSLAVLAGIIALFVVFVRGATWAIDHLLSPLVVVGWVALAIDVLVLLPRGSVLNSVCEPVVESVAQREPLGELYRQLCLGGMPFPRRAFPLGLDLA